MATRTNAIVFLSWQHHDDGLALQLRSALHPLNSWTKAINVDNDV